MRLAFGEDGDWRRPFLEGARIPAGAGGGPLRAASIRIRDGGAEEEGEEVLFEASIRIREADVAVEGEVEYALRAFGGDMRFCSELGRADGLGCGLGL